MIKIAWGLKSSLTRRGELVTPTPEALGLAPPLFAQLRDWAAPVAWGRIDTDLVRQRRVSVRTIRRLGRPLARDAVAS